MTKMLLLQNIQRSFILNESFSAWSVGNILHNSNINGWNFNANLQVAGTPAISVKFEIADSVAGRMLTFRRLTGGVTSMPIITKSIPAQSGILYIEAGIRISTSSQTFALVVGDSSKYITNYQNEMPIKMTFTNNPVTPPNISIANVPNSTGIATIVASPSTSKFYAFKIKLNLDTKKFNLWIDGAQQTDALSGTLDYSCQKASTLSWTIDRIYFAAIGAASSGATQGPALDYIKIYK